MRTLVRVRQNGRNAVLHGQRPPAGRAPGMARVTSLPHRHHFKEEPEFTFRLFLHILPEGVRTLVRVRQNGRNAVLHGQRPPAGRAPGMARVISLLTAIISKKSLNSRSGFFCIFSRREGENPRQGSTKRQERRFAWPAATRRASARDGASNIPPSPPSFQRRA